MCSTGSVKSKLQLDSWLWPCINSNRWSLSSWGHLVMWKRTRQTLHPLKTCWERTGGKKNSGFLGIPKPARWPSLAAQAIMLSGSPTKNTEWAPFVLFCHRESLLVGWELIAGQHWFRVWHGLHSEGRQLPGGHPFLEGNGAHHPASTQNDAAVHRPETCQPGHAGPHLPKARDPQPLSRQLPRGAQGFWHIPYPRSGTCCMHGGTKAPWLLCSSSRVNRFSDEGFCSTLVQEL